ncbi:MAG: PilN domain-containing protein [Tepidanaerobacteraceae bacterium]|nr:PilN domain-containing protein [Tepidanaerobacteraceae bacterium]
MKKEINLLPEKYRKMRQQNRLKILKITGMIIMAIFIIAIIYVPHFIINTLSNENVNIKDKLMKMKDISEYRIIRQQLERDLFRRQKIIEALKSKSNEWSKIINETFQNLPDGMTLISVYFTDGENLKISGEAQNYNLVAQFMVNLLKMDIISEVKPVSITQQENGLYGFEIICVIENGSEKYETE